MDDADRVTEVDVKPSRPRTPWVWGAFGLPGRVLHALHALWRTPGRGDEYVGTLVNAWLAAGGEAVGVRAGERYVDVGTLGGYREALRVAGGARRGVRWKVGGVRLAAGASRCAAVLGRVKATCLRRSGCAAALTRPARDG